MATMAYIAGMPLGRIALIGSAVVLVVILAVSATPYRRARLETFLHPAASCQTSGYQACQALITQGLVAYQRPLYQVLALDAAPSGATPSAAPGAADDARVDLKAMFERLWEVSV